MEATTTETGTPEQQPYIEPTPPEAIGNLPPAWKRTTVSLELPEGITINQWLKGVRTLENTGKGHQWHIGDALLQGEELWPEEWAQAVDPDEEDKRDKESGNSHRVYMQVSRQMPIDTRVSDLTWTHHRVVAFLESPEERKFWLQTALREGLSSRAMERAIRRAHKGEGEEAGPGDLEVLQDPTVRQWLDDYRVLLNEHEKSLPPQANYLKSMLYAHREHAQRQLDRTVAIDCRIVKKAVALMRGTDDEIFTCLQTRGYFMSDPDLDDRLALLIGMGQIYKKEAEGRKKGQRGKMVQVYLPFRTEDDDTEDDPGFD